jgi:hypothetical protein
MAKEPTADSAAPLSGLQHRLNRLFEVTRPPTDPAREWRNTEVVDACKAAGKELSTSHLSELRGGVKTNPSKRVLEALAWFFDVRAGYFTDDRPDDVVNELAAREAAIAATLDSQRRDREELAEAARELTQAIRRAGVTNLAHRGMSRSETARTRAAQMRALTKLILDDEND